MSHQVYARKWRPRSFQEMVGQSHILQALINSLDHNRLHHAYLFTGTRGVGKTSVARILAKALNCEQGVSSKACNQCQTCIDIDKGCFIDLLEIDAASRTRVEDTREILDNIAYAPHRGRYKVYLIDEIHMLSTHSFNALLKTLEEPPEYVKFLLATTDPGKLPVTVLSRCIQLHLKNLLPEQICQQLNHIATEENIPFDIAALELLSHAADGSMRDALSLFEQAVMQSNNHLTETNVRQMLGLADQLKVTQLLQCLANHDASTMFTLIQQMSLDVTDYSSMLESLITLIHKIAVNQVIAESEPPVDIPLSAEDLQLWYQIAIIGRRDLPLAPTARLGFEMVLLRMLAFKPARTELLNVNKPVQVTEAPTAAPTEAPIVQTKKLEPKASEPNSSVDWPSIVEQLKLSGMVQLLATNSTIAEFEDNYLLLHLTPTQAPLLSDNLKNRLNDALTQYFDKKIKLTIEIAKQDIITPAQLNNEKQQQQQQQAEQRVHDSPAVNLIVDQFDATIMANSIKPN